MNPQMPDPNAPAPPAADPGPPIDESFLRRAALYAHGRGGAGWFYWIAALSLVNTAVVLSNVQGGQFVIGLAVTLIVDVGAKMVVAQSPELGNWPIVLAVCFDVLVAGVVCLFGVFAQRRVLVVFVFGMVLYALDGLIFVLFEDWLSAGFHAFALFSMWGGLNAFRELSRLDREAAVDDLVPPRDS